MLFVIRYPMSSDCSSGSSSLIFGMGGLEGYCIFY
jgi:hypothetical protein